LLIKSIGLCLTVASGLWLGKEGPLVHVACCCANLFLKGFKSLNGNEARKREVLSAAAAAGISVAFGSPIGGVLFSLEQLSYYFPDKTMWQSFVCAMVAAVTLQGFNPFRTGKLVLYQVTYHRGWHNFEMAPFALLGILGGLYGGLFIKLNMKIAEWRQNRTYFRGPVLEVVAVALITALINFPIKFMRAQASELVYTLFAECADITDDQIGLCVSGKANTAVVTLLLVAAVLGFFLAALTFGLQIPAGIILPSMAIGALYGRAIGLIMEVWQANHPAWIFFKACEPDVQCITPGTYAIIGAASALGGATRMTVSIVVIMFELTGALTYVLPIMIAVMLSKWVGDFISPRGIYESWIQFNGLPYLDNRDETLATVSDVPINEIMTRIEDLVVITATDHTIQTLNNLLTSYTFRGFPIIDNARNAVLRGYISRTELTFALTSAIDARKLPPETEAFFLHQPLADPTLTLDLRPWMDQTPITLNANSSFGLVVSMFQKLGLRYVLFSDKGALRGLMTKKDVWLVLNGRRIDDMGGRQSMLAEDTGQDEGVSRGLMGNDDDDDRQE
jgi:chloride channel 3/4/5